MLLLTEKRRILWLGPKAIPNKIASVIGKDWEITRGNPFILPPRIDDEIDLVLIFPPSDEGVGTHWLAELLDKVNRSKAVAVIFLPKVSPFREMLAHCSGQFVVIDPQASTAEISARIETAAALQPIIRDLHDDLASRCSHLSSKNHETQDNIERELRLAAQLQRAFLPKKFPSVGLVRFSALFRPLGWVSGDIYDVRRLDEENICFYVADVVGHGLPAALMTMFIKRALLTKRIEGNRYEIISPAETLSALNTDICQQSLKSHQFCTIFYGIINAKTLTLRYARGGHPCPYLLDRNSDRIEQISSNGAIVGIFPDETFEEREIQLSAGQRVVVFSDGAEELLCSAHTMKTAKTMREILNSVRQLPLNEMMLQLAMKIDTQRSSTIHKEDDATILVMDISEGH
ncbi:MAG: serine/threonine-protein phosphatase [Planctomycetes bacterium]|nr:serine/threonine-protein phosphatase [Planctomycetota bacterium]